MFGSEIKLGLIGAGPWGKNYIRTLSEIPGVKLTRVASRNPSTAQLVDKDCIVEEDWHCVAKATDINGVIIATPPHCHGAMVKCALNTGLATLVEKPITSTQREAEELLLLAEKKRSLVMVDHIHLFHPGFRALKKLAKEARQIQTINSTGGGYGPFRKDIRALWDWGTHDIAMCTELIGLSPKVVRARYLKRAKEGYEMGELIETELVFPNGTEAILRFGNLMEEKIRVFKIKLEECSLIYEPKKSNCLVKVNQSKEIDSGALAIEAIAVRKELPLNCILKEFAASISSAKKDISSLYLSLKVINVLEDISRILDD